MKRFSIAMLLAMLAVPAAEAQQGVTDTEIVIGSVNDLSGPFASFGAPAVKAAQLHFDAVNEAGGIHGRNVRFVVEDMGYQLPQAVQAYNKLVDLDRVFAMFLSMGTPMNLAGFKLLTAKNIPNFAPLSGSRQMLQEPSRLKFGAVSFYYDEIRRGARYLAEQEGLSNVCAMILPTDFGEELLTGLSDEAAANDAIELRAESRHKPDETEFVGALQRLSADGCELVALALGVRQVITVVATAKKLGLENLRFLGPSASFHSVMAAVPGGVTEGLYAAAGWTDLAARAEEPAAAAFIADYQEAYDEFPGTGAMLGHATAVQLTKALEAAGPDLTTESFVAGVESLDYHDPILGNAVSYGPEDHQGSDSIVLSVIENGQWRVVTRLE